MTAFTLFFHGLWILCAAGAVAFATTPAVRTRRLGLSAAGFVLGWFVARPEALPDSAWLGGLVAAVSMYQLLRPTSIVLPLTMSGALGAIWGALMAVQGVPYPLALAIAAAFVIATTELASGRAAFAPELLREDAHLLVLALAVVVAVSPGLLDGWQSAVTLNAGTPTETADVPEWAWYAVSGPTLLGGLYSWWMRR